MAEARTFGPEGIPERTLGWNLLAWSRRYLRQPDGPDALGPFKFTREQVRFLLWWYAVDENGKFVYTSGVLRRMKGWGKDPVGAALALMELCGPTQFSHFNEKGEPVGVPMAAPWIQVAAVSRDQTRNTFTLFPTMISDDLQLDYGLEINKEIIHKSGGGRIEAVTSSPKALEGGRSHFVLMNETQFWLENNQGKEMAGAIAGNVSKIRGGVARRLAICNAHIPGMESVAEDDYRLFQKIQGGQSGKSSFLYDCVEAPADTELKDPESLRAGLLAARGDSDWLDVDRLLEEIYDPRNSVSESRRKYLNQVVAAEDSWISDVEWSAICEPEELAPNTEITLGFDGSRSDDATALVACRLSDGKLFPIKVWEHPPHDPEWTVPVDMVNGYVDWCFAEYKVISFFSDVYPWESSVDRWTVEYGRRMKVKAGPKSPIGFDMRFREKDFTLAAEAFHDAVMEKTVTHNGDYTLTEHMLNTKRRPNRFGTSISKEHRESSRKIDAAVAAVLAFAARQALVKTRKTGPKRVVFMR